MVGWLAVTGGGCIASATLVLVKQVGSALVLLGAGLAVHMMLHFELRCVGPVTLLLAGVWV